MKRTALALSTLAALLLAGCSAFDFGSPVSWLNKTERVVRAVTACADKIADKREAWVERCARDLVKRNDALSRDEARASCGLQLDGKLAEVRPAAPLRLVDPATGGELELGGPCSSMALAAVDHGDPGLAPVTGAMSQCVGDCMDGGGRWNWCLLCCRDGDDC